MKAIAQTFDTREPVQPKITAVKTTLYELIGAINDALKPGEDRLVVETVLDLFDRGQVKFLSASASAMNN